MESELLSRSLTPKDVQGLMGLSSIELQLLCIINTHQAQVFGEKARLEAIQELQLLLQTETLKEGLARRMNFESKDLFGTGFNGTLTGVTQESLALQQRIEWTQSLLPYLSL
jgi:hypothetical protein